LTGVKDSLVGQWPITLGLSFFALQVAGVSSDVFRREISLPRFIDFILFILLGFKFYSGPIERADDLDRIVNQVERLTIARAWEGYSYAVLGFFMKFVLANSLADLVILDTSTPVATLGVATIAELRIYFDFAGYSFMAYGLAMFAGINLTINFRQPFQAQNIQDFWRRWHVGLGRWLHKYVYSPTRDDLRARQVPTIFVVLITFGFSALWHGVSLNYFLWGLLHAVSFVLFVRVFSQQQWSRLIGLASLVSLLVIARMLSIDSDTLRLLAKLMAFGDVVAWRDGFASLSSLQNELTRAQIIFVVLAALFIALESLSTKLYGTSDYRLFRTTVGILSIIFITILKKIIFIIDNIHISRLI
jgi:D-alanyl-lipoteichoic acid acyltransferase DltB (MBOAT superfamily)